MPPRAIKHQLTCPLELTSGSFLIGRRDILVVSKNRLARDTLVILQSVKRYVDPLRLNTLKTLLLYCGGIRDSSVPLGHPVGMEDHSVTNIQWCRFLMEDYSSCLPKCPGGTLSSLTFAGSIRESKFHLQGIVKFLPENPKYQTELKILYKMAPDFAMISENCPSELMIFSSVLTWTYQILRWFSLDSKYQTQPKNVDQKISDRSSRI